MKIGVVIVTHYHLGAEFLQALRLIVPEAPNFVSVSVDPNQSVDEMRTAIAAAIKKAEQGAGVLILTDMFGGTPSNIALSFLGEMNVEVVTGINLPMLIKIFEVRGRRGLAAAVSAAQEAGRKYICLATGAKVGTKSKK